MRYFLLLLLCLSSGVIRAQQGLLLLESQVFSSPEIPFAPLIEAYGEYGGPRAVWSLWQVAVHPHHQSELMVGGRYEFAQGFHMGLGAGFEVYSRHHQGLEGLPTTKELVFGPRVGAVFRLENAPWHAFGVVEAGESDAYNYISFAEYSLGRISIGLHLQRFAGVGPRVSYGKNKIKIYGAGLKGIGTPYTITFGLSAEFQKGAPE